MPDRCTVGGCSNESNSELGISLHRIPFYNDERPEAKKRRKRWTDFVLRTRSHWKATKLSTVCSDHFVYEDYQRYAVEVPDTRAYTPRLKKDDVGIVVFPTVTKVREEKPPSARSLRQKKKEREHLVRESLNCVVEEHDEGHIAEDEEEKGEEDPTDNVAVQEYLQPSVSMEAFDGTEPQVQVSIPSFISRDAKNSTSIACSECVRLAKRNRQLRNNWFTAKYKLRKCRLQLSSSLGSKQSDCNKEKEREPIMETVENDIEKNVIDESMDTDTESCGATEDECETANYTAETDTTDTSTGSETEDGMDSRYNNLVYINNDNIRTEPKFITFLSQLLILFNFCHFCHAPNPLVETRQLGTMAEKILFPSIIIHWKKYQQKLLDNVKSLGSKIVIAGDGRHDSMGHSAKYCSYTIFCCDVSKIIHFDLVQKNESGSSTAMEYMGFQRSMTFLLGTGISISTFISDRHTGIAKHMREQLTKITHYFDLWHLKKKINKVLTKLSKESGGEVLTPWIKPCGNHLYWSACSTYDGNGQVMWAKFRSYLDHIVNRHEDLQDPLFNKCNHGRDIAPRQWLQKDSVVYEKLTKALTNQNLVKAIKQASPIAQTSCLEGFHSVLNQFAPKMISYSFAGMYCRQIIAVLHFNSNLQRDVRAKADGQQQLKVVWPKFKNGEATVRDVRVVPNFDYVEEIFQTMKDCLKEKTRLDAARGEILDMTPAPINTMLERETREEALRKREQRKKMNMKDVPPTTPAAEVQAMQQQRVEQSAAANSRAKPHCSVCKNPMKGHSKITDCPRTLALNTTH
ncbi:hypothetical protein QZH41_010695 [Actinostola sp. cb2023]|nr:hypothetical protein QZH41_010695 [Actinostola sp. cb2023]